jgi:hypothetical protein
MSSSSKIPKIKTEFLCQSKNGKNIVFDPVYSHLATHLEDTPQLKNLVIEVLTNMTLEGEKIGTFVNLGRIVGTCDVVDVDDIDEIVYGIRKNRTEEGHVPFTKTREAKPSSSVAVQLLRLDGATYELASAWVGTYGEDEDEPFPNAPDANERSKDFWSKHAFVWGSQEIQPGTLRTDCPW